jgi:dolichol kinase
MTPPLAFWAFAGAYGLLFAAIEVFKRRTSIPATRTRKATHLGSALLSLGLPTYLEPHWIVLLSLSFTAVLFISKSQHILTSIHNVPRKTWGEVYFPLGIALSAALVFWGPWTTGVDRDNAFQFGMLVLGLLDVAAELGGSLPSPTLWFGKTLSGSLSFMLAGIMLFLACGLPFSPEMLAAVLGLTASESLLGRGLDNLALPSLGALTYLLLGAS